MTSHTINKSQWFPCLSHKILHCFSLLPLTCSQDEIRFSPFVPQGGPWIRRINSPGKLLVRQSVGLHPRPQEDTTLESSDCDLTSPPNRWFWFWTAASDGKENLLVLVATGLWSLSRICVSHELHALLSLTFLLILQTPYFRTVLYDWNPTLAFSFLLPSSFHPSFLPPPFLFSSF